MGGKFVYSLDNELGVGKAVDADGDSVTVEYFKSVAPGGIFTRVIPRKALRRYRLELQARCRVKVEGDWRVGRVVWNSDEGSARSYGVKLPNTTAAIMVPESELFVRCNAEPEDISEVVAALGTETPFFHNRRSDFISSLIAQRRGSQGMTGLLSSSVRLFEHQVEVVRRVLADPVQRYLLADEVGLGKTIEAGILIRQQLLDVPSSTVIVIAPPFLRRQWVKELQQKFQVEDFSEAKIVVLSSTEPDTWTQYSKPDLLIVDEVHHLAGAQDAKFESLETMCGSAEKLLLLSATPLLNNEATFHRMLHLLDPDIYRLEDLEGFQERVRARQSLSALFYQLKDDAPEFILKSACETLRKSFPRDKRLAKYTAAVQSALVRDEEDRTRARVRELRYYVSETFRVHRRMLRTRRDGNLTRSFPLRGRKQPEVLVDSTPERGAILDGIEEWRHVVTSSSDTNQAAIDGVWSMLESTLSDTQTMKTVLSERLEEGSRSGLVEGEKQCLVDLISACDRASEERLDVLEARLAQELSKDRKVVVFASHETTASRVQARLAVKFGTERVGGHLASMDPAEAESAVESFVSATSGAVLVCDRSGEEGRNFQAADLMVHFDLCLSPNRLEQRLGRIDRYSNGEPFDSLVFVDHVESLSEMWKEILSTEFGIFDQSIASLQFEIDHVMEEVRRAVVDKGNLGLSESTMGLNDRLNVARRELAEQDALDSIEEPAEAQALFSGLDELEDAWFQIQKATTMWAGDEDGGLRFAVTPKLGASHVLGFHMIMPGRGMDINSMPLVDWRVLKEDFAGLTSSPERPRWGSFDRRVATDGARYRLFRIGEPFIEALRYLTMTDDRGRAFLMHRLVPTGDPLDGRSVFLFDYLVEADLTNLCAALAEQPGWDDSLAQRLGDRFLPPQMLRVWVDLKGEEISDRAELRTLDSPYKKPRDVNVSPERRHLLEQQIGIQAWEQACRETREGSEEIARNRADVERICAEAADEARRMLGASIELRKGRCENLTPLSREKELADLEVEQRILDALLEGIQRPRLSLDAMGLVMLGSNRP